MLGTVAGKFLFVQHTRKKPQNWAQPDGMSAQEVDPKMDHFVSQPLRQPKSTDRQTPMRETNARCARCYARCACGAHGLVRVVLLTHHFFI